MRRVLRDFALGAILLFILTLWPPLSNWGQIKPIAIGAISGVLLGERRLLWLLWRWVMALFRAARILIEQDLHPEAFITPIITTVNINPRIDNASYILVGLGWDSKLAQDAQVSDVKGEVRIANCMTVFQLPVTIPPITVQRFQKAFYKNDQSSESHFQVQLVGDAHTKIQEERQKPCGTVTVYVTIQAKINGKSHDFQRLSRRAYVT